MGPCDAIYYRLKRFIIDKIILGLYISEVTLMISQQIKDGQKIMFLIS